jgi:murein endopeptidase
VWLEDEIDWFSSLSRSVTAAVVPGPPLFVSGGTATLPLSGAAVTADDDRSAARRRRLATRLLPAAVVLAATAAAVPLLLPRAAEESAMPPVGALAPTVLSPAPRAHWEIPAVTAAPPAAPSAEFEALYPEIRWNRSQSVGLPYSGRLVDGVQLPVEGWDWVTWDPALDRVPNRTARLYGTDALVRMVLDVVADYRRAHPDAPRVVVGDLTRRGGGPIDEHVSHQSGLDVDVYYPRRDGRLRPPHTAAQIDVPLAQELVDRFVAAGAKLVLVGYSTPLRGPDGVVMTWPNHDNHMHVRIARPAASR